MVPLMTSMKGHGRNHDGDDFGSAGARASHPPAPARCSAYDRGQRSARSTCGRSLWLAMPTPPRRTGRPRPRRSRYSSATSASGCAEGALQRNGYAVTQRCVATVAPQQPRNGVTPSRPSTATPAIACSMSSWSRTPWLNRSGAGEPAAAVDSDHQFLALEDDFVVLPCACLTANFPSRPIIEENGLFSVMRRISGRLAIV